MNWIKKIQKYSSCFPAFLRGFCMPFKRTGAVVLFRSLFNTMSGLLHIGSEAMSGIAAGNEKNEECGEDNGYKCELEWGDHNFLPF